MKDTSMWHIRVNQWHCDIYDKRAEQVD